MRHPKKSRLRCNIFIYSVSTRGLGEHLQSLHFQIGVLVVARGWCRVLVAVSRLHLLNRRGIDNGHWHHNILRKASLHLPVLLTQGTRVHAAVHQARVTRRVLQSAKTRVHKPDNQMPLNYFQDQ